MSLIRLIIADKTTALTGDIHGSEADRLVASLTAEPVTIEEFERASKRFRRSESEWPMARWFDRFERSCPVDLINGLVLEPFDAGIVVIDLYGKTMLVESTYSDPAPDGYIRVRDRLAAEEDDSEPYFQLPYAIPEDWSVIRYLECFSGAAIERRQFAAENPDRDFRSVLYGDVFLRFLVEQVASKELPLSDSEIKSIHMDWLVGERPELSGLTPREVLLEKKSFIDSDLHSRSLQHSITKEIPPPLDTSSHAYKHAGFGTHEIVVYYYLVRELIKLVSAKFEQLIEIDLLEEVAWLEKRRDQWLESENDEFSGRKPGTINEFERRRENITMEPSETIIDEDCPICLEMASAFDTPTFWHLDGSCMDEEFEFSFHQTLEEWEDERREWEEFERRRMKDEILGKKSFPFEIQDPEDFLRLMRGNLPD